MHSRRIAVALVRGMALAVAVSLTDELGIYGGFVVGVNNATSVAA